MPIPETRDVGKTIRFLKKEKPGMPQKQKVAIALETARRAGAKIPKPNPGSVWSPGTKQFLSHEGV